MSEDETKTATHTPRPWEKVPQHQNGPIIAHLYKTGDPMHPSGLRIIAEVFERESSIDEDAANVALIEAAPDLLAACEGLAAQWDKIRSNSRSWLRTPESEAVYAAIVKAKVAKP